MAPPYTGRRSQSLSGLSCGGEEIQSRSRGQMEGLAFAQKREIRQRGKKHGDRGDKQKMPNGRHINT